MVAMHNLWIFEKWDYKPVSREFRTLGISSLEELTKFQNQFSIYDTDTTINAIRDAIISNYLWFDLLNFAKHWFDAKRSKDNKFLEVKQCSISSNRRWWTWNDTNEEKALAFSDERLLTVVAVWKWASELEFMVYWFHKWLWEYLYDRVINRKPWSRSTQNVWIEMLIKKFWFSVICPPGKSKLYLIKLLANYNKDLLNYINTNGIKSIQDI